MIRQFPVLFSIVGVSRTYEWPDHGDGVLEKYRGVGPRQAHRVNLSKTRLSRIIDLDGPDAMI